MRYHSRQLFAFCLVLTGLTTSYVEADEPEGDNQPVVTFSTELNLGQDVGQNFGSLFELRDKNGAVIAGAGFMEVYNTRFRSDRHTLQFYVKPTQDSQQSQTERLPHPDLGCGIYLMDLNQTISAWGGDRTESLRTWNPKAADWSAAHSPETGPLRSGDGQMRIGDGLLTFCSSTATYNDRVILNPPKVGRYYNFYYANGFLCFYYGNRSEQGGFTRVMACPWTPADQGPVDLTKAISIECKYVGATPFAWGQFQKELLTVSNYGGVYAFDGKQWRTVKEASKKYSYQVYSMLNFRDRLLLAQYPSGELFEYRGGTEIKQLHGWPPRLPEVSPSAREAQTLAIYRGDLFAGVWPWGELWRYNEDENRWHSHGRMFSHPVAHKRTVHPYEEEAKAHNLVLNHWGQRVTGLVPLGDSLMVSTSTKGTYPWLEKYTFLTDDQRREYGTVLDFKMPGNLAAQIKWKDAPIQLEFVVEPQRLVIRQDGQELGSTPFSADDIKRLQDATLTWGNGIFGKLNGTLQNSTRK
ncbi:hypothetical protein Mal35_07420 [Gimesia maris]|uniref:hypothetical protein n=1 Tax=Gimesia maris TaxID=122 RepID=UPI00118B86F3|nr:hypothetical protein [Gimesia maris]QDT77316.1 hypothetical protein Mal35_07420 [Gimesia maris]